MRTPQDARGRLTSMDASAWWRIDGWPTAEEWQAWWGFAAVVVAAILLYVAWKQLSGLAESNKQLTRSNTLLTESNRAMSRPVVVVEYEFEKHASRDYTNTQNESSVYVLVRNVGSSPARDVTLTVSPEFQRASATVGAKTTEFLNELFSGRTSIKMLAPGQKLRYVLDSAREALASKTLPSEYEVTARYSDLERADTFSDSFVLQMSPWGMTIPEVAPLKRISKDIQFVSQSLRDRDKGLPKIATRIREATDAAAAPSRGPVKGSPTIAGRSLRRRLRK